MLILYPQLYWLYFSLLISFQDTLLFYTTKLSTRCVDDVMILQKRKLYISTHSTFIGKLHNFAPILTHGKTSKKNCYSYNIVFCDTIFRKINRQIKHKNYYAETSWDFSWLNKYFCAMRNRKNVMLTLKTRVINSKTSPYELQNSHETIHFLNH